MKRFFCVMVGLALLLSGCSTTQTQDVIFQTSTIDALLAGVYDGEVSLGDLLRHGDFGVGTFDHLDGEMVVFDGTVYQVKADGKVYTPDASMHTPFATVCRFRGDQTVSVKPGTDYDGLKKLIDATAPNQNLFYAVKLTGRFKAMKTRAVPGQKKPYPPLKEVTSHQPEFPMRDVSGTIVGFRCPPFVKGVNVPGYHLHFISDDRTKGGHILSFETADVTACKIDEMNQYFLTLPKEAEAFAKTDLSKDRSRDLMAVEQDKKGD
jgi:acetolactate decarboxylase